jgi:hypothetical protein
MMVWLVLIIVFLVTSGVKNICHSNCETCSGPNINECLTCKTGLRLSQGACCQPGNFYLQALTSCQSCHPTCANCNSASMSDCTDCPPNRNILPTKQCVCKEGTYDSGATCSPCDTSCYTCSASGPNSCTGCKELAVLDLTTKSCKCRDGTYLDATTNSCAKCDISCKTCAGPGRSQCNSCGLLATFSPSGATGFCSCTSESYGPSGNCITCDPTCMTCSGPSAQECLTCRVGMYKDLFGKCKCNPGTIQNANGGCDPCHGSCLECINPSSTGCISCALDRQPQNGLPGACVCRTQTVEILPDLVCQKCHYSCKTCSGLSSSNCLSCGLNSLLSQSTCLSSNLAMFFDTQADSQPCHPSCQACQGPSSTHCTACRSSASFISSATQINSVTVGNLHLSLCQVHGFRRSLCSLPPFLCTVHLCPRLGLHRLCSWHHPLLLGRVSLSCWSVLRLPDHHLLCLTPHMPNLLCWHPHLLSLVSTLVPPHRRLHLCLRVGSHSLWLLVHLPPLLHPCMCSRLDLSLLPLHPQRNPHLGQHLSVSPRSLLRLCHWLLLSVLSEVQDLWCDCRRVHSVQRWTRARPLHAQRSLSLSQHPDLPRLTLRDLPRLLADMQGLCEWE